MSDAAWTVRIEGLSRFFGALKAVHRVSFEIHPGEIFGFIGPNGAGKTTTLKILATLDDPDEGDVWVGSDSILEAPDRVRGRIGFVPDRQGVYSNLTVKEYLDFFARAYSLRGDKRRKAVAAITNFSGLDGLAGRDCGELSKGMRQRLSFARALIHDPDVLLLDEPMEGLDPRARIEFRELLTVLAQEGKAILVSSHILTELSEFVSRVAILEKGRLVKTGRLEDLARELAPAAVVRLRLRDGQDPAAAERFLVQFPGVRKVVVQGLLVQVEGDGEVPEGDRLVHALYGAGIRVQSFDSEEASLEDVFLKFTRGDLA